MIRWAVVLGITGFVCGFVGPMVLAPDSNQGPMLGIFITGPAAAMLGATLGVVVGAMNVSAATAARLLAGAIVLVATITLYFAIPEPHYYADAVEGEIRECTTPDLLRDDAVKRLNELAANHAPLPQPVAWDEAFDKALDQDHGVLLEVHLSRYRRLYRREARWNRDTLEAGPWVGSDATATYYAIYGGPECDGYAAGPDTQFNVVSRVGIWPPAGLAEMLNVSVATPLDPEETRVIGATPSR
jgi:hypothetical protein